ncbi:hypothetical protein [Thioalkalivibrio sp. ALE23]|uniref:hypothetical protein n=1 Tax=Thioalkalivibrio sp. ALE23 TaxID=1265495 RepID=UPI0012DF6BB2|nr:hypothetical protein [Thioalkalivibrio sp. ALE23]
MKSTNTPENAKASPGFFYARRPPEEIAKKEEIRRMESPSISERNAMNRKKSMMTAAMLAAMMTTGGAQAQWGSSGWELNCEIDRFTDEGTCSIDQTQRSAYAFITPDTDNESLTIAVGDTETLFHPSMLMRVEDGEVWDLAEESETVQATRGSVLVTLNRETAMEVIEEMQQGPETLFRLEEHTGDTIDFKMDATELDDVWRQFRENTGF